MRIVTLHWLKAGDAQSALLKLFLSCWLPLYLDWSWFDEFIIDLQRLVVAFIQQSYDNCVHVGKEESFNFKWSIAYFNQEQDQFLMFLALLKRSTSRSTAWPEYPQWAEHRECRRPVCSLAQEGRGLVLVLTSCFLFMGLFICAGLCC